MFDWSGENRDKLGKSQGIFISCVSGKPVYISSHLWYNNLSYI